MRKNLGNTDRTVRIVAGLVLIAFALFGPDTMWAKVAWIGVVPLLTGALGICPAYSLFGASTCPSPKS